MKLAEHYGHKPAEELPMLFHRILSNCTLDWFRRQKTHNALFSNMGEFESGDDGDFDILETLNASSNSEQNESTETKADRAQTLLKFNNCQYVNAKPFSCVTGRNWMLRKQLRLWAARRGVSKHTAHGRFTHSLKL